MKFAAIIEYGGDKGRLKANHPAHRTYLRTFLENGQLRAAGPFADEPAQYGCWMPILRKRPRRSSRETRLLVSVSSPAGEYVQ